MIKTVASVGLPVDETLSIKKRRMQPQNKTKGMKRICIVTGIHGDELEGQYVCFEVAKKIEEQMEKLAGIVDIYPAMNPLGIDIHASNIFLTEIPQIRINELHQELLVPFAEKSNVDFVWVHGASTVLESTFAYSLNSTGTPCLVVEMGVGMRIAKEYGEQLVDGIFHLMETMGMWKGETPMPRKPIISKDPEDVSYLNARVGGLFIQKVKHWEKLKKGDLIGQIINPLSGKVLDNVLSPVDGILFTIREYPVVDEGISTVETALKFEMPYVVVRKVRPYDTATLNYNWQVWNTQAFSFYTTTTTSVDRNSAGQAVLSILKFLASLGIVKYQSGGNKKETVVVNDTDMVSVRTAKSGIFESLVKVGEDVREGTPLANIVHPYEGEIMETLYAPVDSKIFFMHTDPLTYANTAVFKLVETKL